MGLTILFGRRVRTLSRALQDRTADLSTHIEETVAAVRTVQAFDQQTREVGQFSAAADTARDSVVGSERNSALRSADTVSTSSLARADADTMACASEPVLSSFVRRASNAPRTSRAGLPPMVTFTGSVRRS
jgi:ABC-type multidrug transport system fused ATPase/permease subunit